MASDYSVIRVAERQRFTIVVQDTTRDGRLSFRARGLLFWMLDQPPGTSLASEVLTEHGTEGRDAIRSALKELEDHGYLVRQKVRGEGGRVRTVATVYERPNAQVPPETAFQAPGNQAAVDQAAVSQASKEGLSPEVQPSPRAGGGAPPPVVQQPATNGATVTTDPSEYSQAFLRFWDLYPRKIEKKAAWRKWKATVTRYGAAVRGDLVAAAENYGLAKVGTDPKVIKHPATFLGPDEPWKDWVRGNPDAAAEQDIARVPESLRF